MKLLYFLVLIFVFIACQSGARYTAIKKERAEYFSNKKSPSVKNYDSLIQFIEDWKNTPYEYGGMDENGIDCSGFTSLAFLKVYGKELPRTARDQYLKGRKISQSRLLRGDLVFFKGVRSRGIDHVGIYLEDGKFAHATESRGIIISELSETYYEDRYIGACRY